MTLPAQTALTLADRWILTRLRETIVRMSALFDAYDFGNVTETIWRFLWYEFCDWYVEATKAEENRATRAAVLSFVWNAAMRLLHPLAPFISEEIWLALPHDGESIVTANWPDPLEVPESVPAARDFEGIVSAVERLRNQRAEIGLHPRERAVCEVPANLRDDAAALLALYAGADLDRTGNPTESLEEALATVRLRASAALLEERYRKALAHLQSEIDRGERKLANEAFVAKAAPDVVAKEREKLEGYRAELARTEAALRALKEPA
jgi:valyl-tRNA synthetase